MMHECLCLQTMHACTVDRSANTSAISKHNHAHMFQCMLRADYFGCCKTARQNWQAIAAHALAYTVVAAAAVSLLQAERLEELQERLAVPYDGANPAHQEQLRELWGLAFPGQPCEALKTPKWKDMGWQVRKQRH